MATTAQTQQDTYQKALVSYLISMAKNVENTINRAIDALLQRNEPLASEIFLNEPRINEMEIVIDEHAVRLLRTPGLSEGDIRLAVATLKINNDLERMGDLAVNIGQRVVTLAQMEAAERPPELEPMAAAVRAMVSRSLGALVYRNTQLANTVLESDDLVDRYRDIIFEQLLASMSQDARQAAPNLQFILATRYLERIADHCTKIAEDIVYWVRGLDVRHGRGLEQAKSAAAADPSM